MLNLSQDFEKSKVKMIENDSIYLFQKNKMNNLREEIS